MPTIIDIQAREILDSRGNPTIETEVVLASGAVGVAAVPSGASTGKREALELRDGDKKRYGGKGVLKAVQNVEEIITPSLIGLDATEQRAIDQLLLELDDTENKSHLGANAMLSVSMAVARAAADFYSVPLYRYLGGVGAHLMPVPMMNVLNGGAHADNNVDVQEFMIVPIGAPNFAEAVRMCAEVYQNLKKVLKADGHNTAIGDEGGFAPNLGANHEAIDCIINAIKEAKYRPGIDIAIALDVAASEFYDEKTKKYNLASENKKLTPENLVELYASWLEKYPIVSIEDGLAEGDWQGWKLMTEVLGEKTQLVGDDIFVTNPQIFKRGLDEEIANSILIKLNQIGTLTETIDVVNMAHKNGYTTIISHRSGETGDTFIADLAVAMGSGQIKTGAPCRSERVDKYNRLLRIERELDDAARYAGSAVYKQTAKPAAPKKK